MSPVKIPEPLPPRLLAAERLVITSHINPDGDAVGSGLGLAHLLRRLGKEAQVWNRDETPTAYRPLVGSADIHTGTEPPPGFPERFDLAVLLECPTLDRSGIEEQITRLPMINIDHHLGNSEYGEIQWIDTEAPAVGAMLPRLAEALGVELDPEAATAFYVALVTDTGGFRFANAGPEAFETAAALVRAGARPEQASQWLYESNPEAAVRLLGEILSSLELHHGGSIATVWLTREMMERTGARPGDSEGLIDHPRSIAGVEAVAMLKELDGGRVKVSLRSRGELSVEKIAKAHGGGGHRNAAGCTVETDSGEELQSRLVAALSAALDELGA